MCCEKIFYDDSYTGTATVEVEVDDDATDDEIYGAATEAFDNDVDDWSWDFMPVIVEGNVFHGGQNKWEYEVLDDEEDDEQEE